MPWTLRCGFNFPFRRKRYTVTESDPMYHVTYLGNVLTILAKGESCVARPLELIWRTFEQSGSRSDLQMTLRVTRSGLKAETKTQGLTEYWAHRITYCLAPEDYPKVFCWVYKHEGRRMKPELRCHAVLCRKTAEPSIIVSKLNGCLQAALNEYKREKLIRQNTRLLGANGQQAACPQRKMLLTRGAHNFRPPVSRSKSAPRLGMIEEDLNEDDGEEENSGENGFEPPIVEMEEILDETTTTTIGPFVDADSLHPSLIAKIDLHLERQLKLDTRLFRLQNRSKSMEIEPDSISDESGYHEDKHSLNGDDDDDYLNLVEVHSTAL